MSFYKKSLFVAEAATEITGTTAFILAKSPTKEKEFIRVQLDYKCENFSDYYPETNEFKHKNFPKIKANTISFTKDGSFLSRIGDCTTFNTCYNLDINDEIITIPFDFKNTKDLVLNKKENKMTILNNNELVTFSINKNPIEITKNNTSKIPRICDCNNSRHSCQIISISHDANYYVALNLDGYSVFTTKSNLNNNKMYPIKLGNFIVCSSYSWFNNEMVFFNIENSEILLLDTDTGIIKQLTYFDNIDINKNKKPNINLLTIDEKYMMNDWFKIITNNLHIYHLGDKIIASDLKDKKINVINKKNGSILYSINYENNYKIAYTENYLVLIEQKGFLQSNEFNVYDLHTGKYIKKVSQDLNVIDAYGC